MKTNFLFGRVHIDIYQRRVHVQQEDNLGVASAHEALAVSFHDGPDDELVSDVPLVEITEDAIPPAPIQVGGC